MMKRKKNIIAICVAAIFGGITAVTSSLAWMNITASMERSHNPIEGTVEDAYYASGSGTQADPFIITRPRHLYNLAWLQLLGYYNKTGQEDHQFYFELGDNIDMGDYCPIPPIGTEYNPFAGNFNGNGYVVSNLTVSNDFNDYTYHPSVISGWSSGYRSQPHILGLFGVVGSHTNGTMPRGYSSAANEVINTGITGANIKTVLTDSLMGVTAGYVNDTNLTDGHNVLKNVVVDNSKITLPSTGTTSSYGGFTSNISDYTLVGFTNVTADVVKASKTIYGINVENNISFAASEDGNVSGWGGSVNMKEMYNGLHDIWTAFKKNGRNNTGINAIEYYTSKDVYYDKNGDLVEDSTVESGATVNRFSHDENGTFSSGDYYHAYYNYEQRDTDTKITASYGFEIEETASNEENFMCLTGRKSIPVPGAQTLTTHYYDSFVGKYICVTVNNTKHYLTNNGTSGITDTTDKNSACTWNLADGALYTTVNETPYYLNRSNDTTITLGTSANSTWSYDSTNNRMIMMYNNTGYALYYSTTNNNTGWKIVSGTGYYIIYNKTGTTYYFADVSNDRVQSTTNINNATHWSYDSSRKCYYYSSNKYLGYYSDNYLVQAASDSKSYYLLSTGNLTGEGYLQTTYSGSTYYVRLNGSTWTADANSSANATTMVVELKTTVTIPNKGYGDVDFSETASTTSYAARTRTQTVDATVEVNATFFPLRQEADKPGVPADTNTGYVVSGANYWGDPYGDIRVSKYSKSQYLSSGLSTVYTINASGNRETVSAANFKKYDAAKASMQEVLDGDTDIYGLHFMNANITYGGVNPILAEKVIVNGDTHYDYELPSDCVDFNLKEKGFINFFAGTYYSGNNCFFSLHDIFRSGNSITDVKEITEIYEDPSDTADVQSYVYKYSDNTYSVPFKHLDGEKVKLDGSAYVENTTSNSKPAAYSKLAFATSRIKYSSVISSNTNKAFYFEIPMHEGEYCLGSVPGYNGAYLMYLDIAANASKTNRTIFYQKFSVNETTYNYPVGVSLGELPTSYSAGVATIDINAVVDASDSACMRIEATCLGVYEIDRSGADVALSRANTTHAPPVYCSDTISLIHEKGSNTALSVTALSTTSYTIKQMELYDYSIIADTLTVTTITDYSTDGGSTYSRRIVQTKYGGDTTSGAIKSKYTYDPSLEVDESSSMKVYNHNNNGARVSAGDLITTTVFVIPDNKLSNVVLLAYSLLQDGGDAYHDLVTVVAMLDENITTGTYYTYNGITMTVTPESGTITIKVDSTSYASSFTITIYNYAAGTSSTTTGTTVITINGTPVTGGSQTIVIETPAP